MIGEPAVGPLIQSTRHGHPLIRRGAVQALGIIGESRAVPQIVEALKDPDAGVRHESAIALGHIGDPRAVSPLIESLNDAKENVRMAVMATLCSLGEHAIGPLSGHWWTRMKRSAGGHRSLSSPSANRPVESLIHALKDQSPGIRRGVIEVLGQIGNTRAIAPIMTELNDPERLVRIEAVRSLAALGVPAIAPLMQVFREGDIRTRTSAMEALWMLRISGQQRR